MPRMPMLITAGLLAAFALGGCAGGPRARPIQWQPVKDRPGDPPVALQDGLYLAGQSIRTVNRYSSPVSVEFDLALLEAEGPIAGVTLTMVTETGEPVAVTVDWAEPPFHLKAGQPYRLRFDLFGHARVRVNGLDLEQARPATPDGSFHLQLDVSPSRSRWHLRDVRIQ